MEKLSKEDLDVLLCQSFNVLVFPLHKHKCKNNMEDGDVTNSSQNLPD